MSPNERWHVVRDLFRQAIRLSPKHRQRLLAEVDDRDVRDEADRLLRCAATAGDEINAVIIGAKADIDSMTGPDSEND